MASASDMVGTVLDGRLRIDRALASGAAGDVYEAFHLGLGTRVAVKVLKPGGGETADVRRRRFVREARVAARLRSPNVVRVFDIVESSEGLTYLVMELLHGETVAERLARGGALPLEEAVSVVLQGGRALAEMHEAGMVHRDVKPSNLFLAVDGERTTVMLLDFGIAALQQPITPSDGQESSITMSEAFVGTPRYVAPEQVRSSKGVDARADVWALGVTLHELLAGAPPFDGQTVIAVLNQIEKRDPPVLEQLRTDVPPALGAFVRRCMARSRDDRPADAGAFVEELSRLVATPGAGASARDGHPQRRRGRVIFVAASMAVAVLVVVMGLRRAGEAQAPQAAEAPSTLASTAPPDTAPPPTLTAAVPAVPTPTPPSMAVDALPIAPMTPPPVTAPPDPTTTRPRPRAPSRPATTRPVRPTLPSDDRIE